MEDQKLTVAETQTRDQELAKLRLQTTSLSFLNSKELGEGGFGLVRLGVYKQSTKVAIKSILAKNSSKAIQAVENELLLMHYIGNHPNILTCYGYYIDDASRDLHIVLEYAPYNSLSSILYDDEAFPYLSVRLVVGWLSDLANALEHVHSRKIKHRDVKAENLLVFADFRVKLCDFGLAKEHSSSLRTKTSNVSTVGTDGFKDPDPIVQAKGIVYASDIFAWSMTAYQMLKRRAPNMYNSLSIRIKNMIDELKEDEEIIKIQQQEQSSKSYGIEMFERLLRSSAELDYTKRPTAHTMSEQLMTISQELGGDPRLKLNDLDDRYITSLELAARKRGDDTSDASSSSFASSVTPNTAVEIRALTSKQAVELLIQLGCSSDLHERVADLGIEIDGDYLLSIPSAEVLQSLEGSNIIRLPKLVSVYRKLQEVLSTFTPKAITMDMFNTITAILEEREKRKHQEEYEMEIKRQKDELEAKRFKANDSNIHEAVRIWCTNQASALSSFGPIATWNTTQVTTMKELFANQTIFNDDISNWDVSKVTDMNCMFYNASSFNQSLNTWNVSKVTDMTGMFSKAVHFNQPLDDWNVHNVTSMWFMFNEAVKFDQCVDSWDVGNVANMYGMFNYASSFNQPLNSWNVSNVTNMNGMFNGASSFNQLLDRWNVGNVRDMSQMFADGSQGFQHKLTKAPNHVVPSYNMNRRSRWQLSANTNNNRVSFVPPLPSPNQNAVNNSMYLTNHNNMPIPPYVPPYAVQNDGGSEDEDEGYSSYSLDYSHQQQYPNMQPSYGFPFSQPPGICTVPGMPPYMTQGMVPTRVQRVPPPSQSVLPSRAYDPFADPNEKVIPFIEKIANIQQYVVYPPPCHPLQQSMGSLFTSDSTSQFNQSLNSWNVCNVIDMGFMFYGACHFNQPLNNWNVHKVTDINHMFAKASRFNQSLDCWNVNNVTDMSFMFHTASAFNQPLNSWNVQKVINMHSMFKETTAFNQPLDNWNVGNVTNMIEMFANALNFNQVITHWNIGTETKTVNMFLNACAVEITPLIQFDNASLVKAVNMWCDNQTIALRLYGHISHWDTSHVTSMRQLFANKKTFNDDISKWDVSNVTDMTSMFYCAHEFNQPLNDWNVSRVTSMNGMFNGAWRFNQPLDKWNVSNVTSMSSMFYSAASFNQPFDSWNVGRVTDMSRMFKNASNFNHSLDSWNVSRVKQMDEMFESASNFTQMITSWNIDAVISMSGMFYKAGTVTITPSIQFENESLVKAVNLWCNASTIAMHIYGHISNWNTSHVTSMSRLFADKKTFNHDISKWDVSNVTDMSEMFFASSKFNQPLKDWNVTKVKNMRQMFKCASEFNCPINSWKVENDVNIEDMFEYATGFRHPLNEWKKIPYIGSKPDPFLEYRKQQLMKKRNKK